MKSQAQHLTVPLVILAFNVIIGYYIFNNIFRKRAILSVKMISSKKGKGPHEGSDAERSMIHFFQVYKTYPGNIKALANISFKIGQGEFVFITGPSGAGKTTLLKLIIRAERQDRGEILVNKRNVSRLKHSQVPLLRREIGFVFQDFKLLHNKTVYDNMALVLRALGYNKKEIPKRVRQVLKVVGLEEWVLKQSPLKLSGGEQQRVAIARALINTPAIILADEPTGNLDPELTVEIMNLLEKVNTLGTTVVVATHNTGLVTQYQKRIIPLYRGAMAE
jgi:cell division transport system ATP-binding protein